MANIYDKLYKDTAYGDIKASIGLTLVNDAIISVPKFNTVLDVGCGPGYSVLEFLKQGKYANGIETSKYLVEEKLKLLTDSDITRYGSILEIPCAADSFDLVFCTEVLEHIEEKDVITAISELVRVSKKYLYLTICFVDSVIDKDLHLTVKPAEWWDDIFKQFSIKKIKKNVNPTGGIYVFKKT